MVKLVAILDACSDCIALQANGEVPDERPELEEEINTHLGLTSAQFLASASGLDRNGEWPKDAAGDPIDMDHPEYEVSSEDWFSWSPCECCGSTFGGMRNRLSILENEPEAAPKDGGNGC